MAMLRHRTGEFPFLEVIAAFKFAAQPTNRKCRFLNCCGDVLQVWIVEYIYDDDGSVGVKTSKVRAPDYETARQYALGSAPAKDFVMSLHPESEDQFLGTPGIRAREMTGKVVHDLPDPDDDLKDDDDDF
tara:strand:+ start:610 stop:999 length:390 start_codon:yes stop_codon:yes gene_type:complete